MRLDYTGWIRAAAFAASLLAGAAVAQPAAAPQGTDMPTLENLQARIKAVEARRDLDEATRKRVADTYRQAQGEIERTAAMRAEKEAAQRDIVETPAEVARLERALDRTQQTVPDATKDEALAKLTTPEVEKREAAARESVAEARRELEDFARAADEGLAVNASLRGRQQKIGATLEILRDDLATAATPGQTTALADARRQLTRARISAMQAELDLIDTQLALQPGAQRVRELQRDIARQYTERAEAERERMLVVLEQRRTQDAVRAREEISEAVGKYADLPPPVRLIAEANAQLAAELADTSLALDRTLLEVSRLRSAAADLDASQRLIERRAESRTLGREFAQTLIERLRRLPSPEEFARPREEREPLIAQAIDYNVRVERSLQQLGTVDAATARILREQEAALTGAGRAKVEGAVREQVARQRVLLTRLDEQQDALVRALGDVEEAERELVARSRAVQERLMQLLFWVPLAPIGPETFAALEPALQWTLAPSNWRAAGSLLAREAVRFAPLTLLVVVAIVGIYVMRRRLKGQLEALSPSDTPREQYRVSQTLAALAITFVLALPLALLLWYSGWLLGASHAGTGFSQSLGGALRSAGQLYLTLYGFSWLFDRRGVAIRHFHWHAPTMLGLQSQLRRFTAFFVPLIFVVSLNSGTAPHANTASLGRLAFLLAMAWIAWFTFRLFRRAAPVTTRLFERSPRSWRAKLHPLWFSLLVALPLAIGVLAAMGFFFAAGYLFGRLMNTLLLVLAALMAYGVISLWVVMQGSKLYQRKERAAREEATEPPSEPTDLGVARVQTIDIAAIGDQARQLLNLLTTLVVIGGLWIIWRDALPALKVVGDLALWTYVDTVDGEQITRPLTLGGLVVALLVGVVTAVAVRNIGALLDIVLLQRLELQADATYAIKTVTRYAIAGIGIVFATGLLGLSWSKLQWLVAALGVGLGFGLQEIVANFVSGLIVLAERPIRIGDIVTVGDVSGTVTRIRARATSVVDFDNKEVLIPNKAFITERVVNWTLSNQTTRLLLRVGVAYGTDIETAQRAMYQAVRANPDVLVEPPYSVFFVGFGDSALNFEIRAYVDAIDKRLRVTHALNVAIERALRESGIGIPFPQREVILRAAPGTALPTLPPATDQHPGA